MASDPYPVPSVSPLSDITEWRDLLLAAIDEALERDDVWPDGDADTARGYVEDLKLWVSLLETSFYVYPNHAHLWMDEMTVLAGSSPMSRDNPGQQYPYGVQTVQNPAANGDSFKQDFFIAAGTYQFYRLGVKFNTRGKLDWYIDGTLVVSGEDWYVSGASGIVVLNNSTVTIATGGIHELKALVNGKNASSTAYLILLLKLWFQP